MPAPYGEACGCSPSPDQWFCSGPDDCLNETIVVLECASCGLYVSSIEKAEEHEQEFDSDDDHGGWDTARLPASIGIQNPHPDAPPCCDGTGWTGNPKAPCAVHFVPLDPIWWSR